MSVSPEDPDALVPIARPPMLDDAHDAPRWTASPYSRWMHAAMGRARGIPLRYRIILWHIAVVLGFCAILWSALDAGLQLRRYTWDQTPRVRFTSDIQNGFSKGRQSDRLGLVNFYDLTFADHPSGDFGLDYAPLRLLVMTRWAQWLKITRPEAGQWDRDYAFTAPLLDFNTLLEGLAAIGAAAVVLLWTRRRRDAGARVAVTNVWFDPYRGCARALLAALLFWFNPAVIWAAHAWPQWDIWLVPFFIWALFFASLECWFCTVALLAIGAMLKGQILFVSPMFILWPLFSGKPRAALRCVVGLLFATAVIVSPWMLTYLPESALAHMRAAMSWRRYPTPLTDTIHTRLARTWDGPAVRWVLRICAAAILAPLLFGAFGCGAQRRRRSTRLAARDNNPSPAIAGAREMQPALFRMRLWRIARSPLLIRWILRTALALLAVGLITWPFFHLRMTHWPFIFPHSGPLFDITLALGVAFAAMLPFITLRRLPYFIAACAAIALLVCPVIFHGSLSWAYIGFGYGTWHFPTLSRPEANNLSAILATRFHWQLDDPAEFAIFHWKIGPWQVDWAPTIKKFLSALYFIFLIPCGAAAAFHAKKRSARFLVALVAPWVLFFALLPQMHQRYLLWAGCISVVLVAVNWRLTLLHLLLAALAWLQIMHTSLKLSPSWTPRLLKFFEGLHPGVSWMVVLIALVLFFCAITPAPKSALD